MKSVSGTVAVASTLIMYNALGKPTEKTGVVSNKKELLAATPTKQELKANTQALNVQVQKPEKLRPKHEPHQTHPSNQRMGRR